MDRVGGGGPARLAVAERGGFAEDGDIRGWFSDDAEADAGGGGGQGGGGGEEERERQEAEKWEGRGNPQVGHPVVCI